jgi:hypothetical protein
LVRTFRGFPLMKRPGLRRSRLVAAALRVLHQPTRAQHL